MPIIEKHIDKNSRRFLQSENLRYTLLRYGKQEYTASSGFEEGGK